MALGFNFGRYPALSTAASGYNPFFKKPVMEAQSPVLPTNFTFTDLAPYEAAGYADLGKNFQDQISGLKNTVNTQYDTSLKSYADQAAKDRAALAASLSDQSQKAFQLQNPYILEDLNKRGLFTSPTAVSQAQAEKIKELELANEGRLTDFDTTTRTYQNNLASQRLQDLNNLEALGIQANMQAQQSGLEAGFDLTQADLENRLNMSAAEREAALARDLAKQQSRNQLTNSLIGLGGDLGSAYLTSKLLGGKSLLGGGGAGGGGGGTQGGAGSLTGGGSKLFGAGGSLFNTAGTSQLGLGSLGGGLLGYQLGMNAFKPTQAGDQGAANVGSAIGGAAGSVFGPGGSALGSFLGAASGKAQNRLVQGVTNSLGNTAGSVVKYAMPTTAIASVGKSISKAFCFDAYTPISMADGGEKYIKDINLGEETEGGTVLSVRASICAEGDLFDYLGTTVTGSHAVLENNCWVRVADSAYRKPIDGQAIVYSLVTSRHRIFVDDITFADEFETDDHEDLTIEESLAELNKQDGLVGAS